MSGVSDAEVLGSAVLLRGPALVSLLHLAMRGATARRRADQIDLSPAERAVLQSMADAAAAGGWMARSRQDDGAGDPDSSEFEVREWEEISTKEAAVLLGISHRQTQRLASRIGARKVGGALVLDRGAVIAHAAERRANEDPDA